MIPLNLNFHFSTSTRIHLLPPIAHPTVHPHLVQLLEVAALLLTLNIKVLHQIRDIIIIVILLCSSTARWSWLLPLLDRLVRFRELAQRCQ